MDLQNSPTEDILTWSQQDMKMRFPTTRTTLLKQLSAHDESAWTAFFRAYQPVLDARFESPSLISPKGRGRD